MTEAKLALKPSSSSTSQNKTQNDPTNDPTIITQHEELVSPNLKINESDVNVINIVQNADIEFVDLMAQNTNSGVHPYTNMKV